MVEVKKFSGILDKDTPESEVNFNFHIDANNVVFRGDGVSKRVQNMIGNSIRTNSLLPSTGTNQTIGGYYDAIRKRIFIFNWNSNNTQGIYIYNINTAIFEKLIEATSTGSPEDVLGFDPDVYIHSVNILYGGEGQDDSDILYFVDSYKRPTQINIDTYLTNTYPVVKRSYIDVIKAPPKEVPQVTYENDTTVTINNLRNGLYQFRTRFVYDNREKSVYSSGSVVPLPYIVNNNPNDSNTSDNARIAVYVETGNETVKNIEIVGKRTTDNATQGWFLITSLDKEELGIADNSYYRFLFFNDGAYTIVDQEETTQLFDYVPDEANTQELLNGSIPIYGGIKEGYDQVVPDMSISQSNVNYVYQYYNGLLFFGYQKSATNIVLFLTGAGTNDVNGNPTQSVNGKARFKVVASNTSFVDKSFYLDNGTTFLNIPVALTSIATNAGLQGFSVVSTGTNSIELSLPGGVIFGSAFSQNLNAFTESVTSQNAQFSFSEASRYSFGVQYFTDKGKTNGVTYSNNLSITTNPYSSYFSVLFPPLLTLEIRHRPPLWASYYHVVRSDTQTYLNKLFWISSSAYSDDLKVGTANDTRYAYINIDNINSYNDSLNLSSGSVSYEFTKGDRIRFDGVYNNLATPDAIYYYTPRKEYEIIGLVVDPYINNVKRRGNFIQIIFPTLDVAADPFFQFNGTPEFQNFSILIYTPKNTVNIENLPFFEFGKKFEIGNAGAANAYHIGLNSIQSPTTPSAIPAVITFSDGDLFYRSRTIPKSNINLAIGQYLNMDCAFTPYPGSPGYQRVLAVTFEVTTPITVPYGILNNTPSNAFTTRPSFTTIQTLFQNTTTNNVRLRVRFTATISNLSTDGNGISFGSYQVTSGFPGVFKNIISFQVPPGTSKDIKVDAYIDVTSLAKMNIWTGYNGTDRWLVNYTDFKLDVIGIATTKLIEKTWNDYYPIVTNSDSRPTVIDKDAKRSYMPTLVRWGLAYEQNTNINQTNRFKAINFDEIDRSKGDIQRFKAREKILRVFQNRGVGQYGIYARYIQSNDGNGQLTTSNNVITANNIQYYQGDYGLGNMPTSLVSASNKDYFVDPVRGYQVRLSGDGMTPISEMYKGQFYIRNLLVQYNKPFTSPSGITSKILGYYDFFEEQYVCHLQAGQYGSTDPSGQPILLEIENYTFAFNEKNNGYSSFFDFHPDLSLCAEEITYSFKDGELWVHDNYNGYCNFYGVQATPDITTVFNQSLIQKKTWISIAEVANSIWSCPVIYTNVNSYGTQRQQTNLIEADFAVLEGNQHASLLKDVNSIGGIANGDSMKGNWVAVKFQGLNPNNFVFLSEISMKYIISNLTNR
jgi:hypothetical protein